MLMNGSHNFTLTWHQMNKLSGLQLENDVPTCCPESAVGKIPMFLYSCTTELQSQIKFPETEIS